MSLFDSLRYRWRVLRDPEGHAREMEDEIRMHLALEAMQREAAGRGTMSGDEAAYAARRRFGNITNVKEEARMTAGLSWLDTTTQDLRFAFRAFRRTPGFTVVAVLTLAIGIGANTAIFSAVNAMLLRPLPFREPARLMALNLARPAMGSEPARDALPWSYPKFATLREAQTVFSDVALSMEYQGTMTGGEEPERFVDEMVGARYLPLLGIQPALGRNFLPDEDVTPGTAHVVDPRRRAMEAGVQRRSRGARTEHRDRWRAIHRGGRLAARLPRPVRPRGSALAGHVAPGRHAQPGLEP